MRLLIAARLAPLASRPTIDISGAGAARRAEATAGTLDGIVVSLVIGALRLMLLADGLTFIAEALSPPCEGVIAGLGILGVRIADEERADRTALLLGVLRLADRMRVRLSQHDPMPTSVLEAAA